MRNTYGHCCLLGADIEGSVTLGRNQERLSKDSLRVVGATGNMSLDVLLDRLSYGPNCNSLL